MNSLKIVANSLNFWKNDENCSLSWPGWNFTQISPNLPPSWSHQPLFDLSLDLRKCHGKFSDTSYYSDCMHSEQTNILLYIYRRLGEIPPSLHPNLPPVDLRLGKYHRKFGGASCYRDWVNSQQTNILLYIWARPSVTELHFFTL